MLKYFFIGFIFGLALIKGEAISWYRMQEMFHFQGFQIFGFFFTAVPTASVGLFLIRKWNLKTVDKEVIVPKKRLFSKGTIYGSAIFGIGWGLTGACPGPIYVMIGSGYVVALALLLSALAGTWTYSFFRAKLPH